MDLKGSEGLKGDEINLDNEKMFILTEEMIDPYKNNENLPSTEAISKKETDNVFYSEYPIQANDISIYIPAEESTAANTAVSIGAKITKPITVALMVVSMPVAIALVKVLQALEFLQYINVKNMPMNVQFILSLVGEGNVFAGLMDPFGEFYKFSDGREGEEDDGPEQLTIVGRVLFDNFSRRFLVEAEDTVCRTHQILDKQEMSCLGWNNMAEFILQIFILIALKVIFKFLAEIILKAETKRLEKMDLATRHKSFNEMD